MTPDEVRAAAEELPRLHPRFAPLFGYAQAQGHALTYLRGLRWHEGKKNAEAIALDVGDDHVRALQQFLAASPWDYSPFNRNSRPSSPTSWFPPPATGRSVPSACSTSRVSPRRATIPSACSVGGAAAWARRTTARSASSWSA
ncbi:MAG: transposase [Planctomycetes bacterium]|nr:transposase [Planctomycetota bacterium]